MKKKSYTNRKSAMGGSADMNKVSRVKGVYQGIVYDNFAGVPLLATFLGDRWWVTTPGERIQPLEKYYEGGDITFRLLTERSGRPESREVARLLGKALEHPEDLLDRVLSRRVRTLWRLGVDLSHLDEDEPMHLQLDVFRNGGRKDRQGAYSAWCYNAEDGCDFLFDVDGFASKQEAKAWVNQYFDALDQLGISYILE